MAREMIKCERCDCFSPADLGRCRWCNPATRTVDLHVWLEIDGSDPATNAEIAVEVQRTLKRQGFAVVDVEDPPEGTRLVPDVSVALAEHTIPALNKITGSTT